MRACARALGPLFGLLLALPATAGDKPDLQLSIDSPEPGAVAMTGALIANLQADLEIDNG